MPVTRAVKLWGWAKHMSSAKTSGRPKRPLGRSLRTLGHFLPQSQAQRTVSTKPPGNPLALWQRATVSLQSVEMGSACPVGEQRNRTSQRTPLADGPGGENKLSKSTKNLFQYSHIVVTYSSIC